MRKIRDVLRLTADGDDRRQIAMGIAARARPCRSACAARGARAWPLPGELDEAALRAQLYRGALLTPQPDFDRLHGELQRR